MEDHDGGVHRAEYLLGGARWAEFERVTDGTITVEDVPWPSTAAQLLSDLISLARAAEPVLPDSSAGCCHSCVSRHCGSRHICSFQRSVGMDGCRRCKCARDGSRCSASTEEQEAAAGRAAFRRAALRWHPDKFAARYQDRVPHAHWPQLLERVHAFTQELTAAAGSWQRQ